MSAWREAYDTLHKALTAAQAERDRRQEVNPATGEPGWVEYERAVMRSEVNRLRSIYGWRPLESSRIRHAEQQASGHYDYTKKFALHCADLVAYRVDEEASDD